MFVGHYSVAFACRTEQNKIPLWVLFIAVQFLDYIWATLVLLGIEKLRVIRGFMAGSMLDSYFHPYSHSLPMAIIWSILRDFYTGLFASDTAASTADLCLGSSPSQFSRIGYSI